MMSAQSAVVAVMSVLLPCPARLATTALDPPLLVNNIEPTLHVSAHSSVTARRACPGPPPTPALAPPLLVNNIEPTLNVSAHSSVTARRECTRGRAPLLFS